MCVRARCRLDVFLLNLLYNYFKAFWKIHRLKGNSVLKTFTWLFSVSKCETGFALSKSCSKVGFCSTWLFSPLRILSFVVKASVPCGFVHLCFHMEHMLNRWRVVVFFFFPLNPTPTTCFINLRHQVISTFLWTFISADGENDTSRPVAANRTASTCTLAGQKLMEVGTQEKRIESKNVLWLQMRWRASRGEGQGLAVEVWEETVDFKWVLNAIFTFSLTILHRSFVQHCGMHAEMELDVLISHVAGVVLRWVTAGGGFEAPLSAVPPLHQSS